MIFASWLRRHPYFGSIALSLIASTFVIGLRFQSDVTSAQNRVSHDSILIDTACGPIEYQEAGSSVPLLSVQVRPEAGASTRSIMPGSCFDPAPSFVSRAAKSAFNCWMIGPV